MYKAHEYVQSITLEEFCLHDGLTLHNSISCHTIFNILSACKLTKAPKPIPVFGRNRLESTSTFKSRPEWTSRAPSLSTGLVQPMSPQPSEILE